METLLGRNLLLVFNPHEIGREGTVFICKPLPGILSKRDGGDEMYCGSLALSVSSPINFKSRPITKEKTICGAP